MVMIQGSATNAAAPDEIPAVLAINYEVSLPSFRDGVSFTVHHLCFGGFKNVMRATKIDDTESIAVMLLETLKLEFPEVKMSEVDKLEMSDFGKLLKLVMSANKNFENMDFTTPTSLKS